MKTSEIDMRVFAYLLPLCLLAGSGCAFEKPANEADTPASSTVEIEQPKTINLEEPNQPGTLTFTPAQPEVEKADLEEKDGVYFQNGKRFTGLIINQHPNGQIQMRRGSVNGLAHGAWTEWYDDGQVRFFGEWKNGKGDGVFVYFWEDGTLRGRATAVNDIFQGVSENWANSGEKTYEAVMDDGTETTLYRRPQEKE